MKTKEPWTKTNKERIDAQKPKAREKIIKFWAPREPSMMRNINKFLKLENKLPLRLTHRIIDTLMSSTVVTKVMSGEEMFDYIKNLPDELPIAIGPCACRIDTASVAGPDARDFAAGKIKMIKETPELVDVQIGSCGKEFGKLSSYQQITKEELLEKEKEFQNMGLVSNVYVIKDGDGSICHCSSLTCVPFMANKSINYKSAVLIHGDLIAASDSSKCDACGNCLEVCHFYAREIVEKDGRKFSKMNTPDRCYGCGHCSKVCPNNLIRMVPRSKWPEFVENIEVDLPLGNVVK